MKFYAVDCARKLKKTSSLGVRQNPMTHCPIYVSFSLP